MPLVDVVPMPDRLQALLNQARPTAATAPGWYTISNAAGDDEDVATVMIYSEIGGYYGIDVADFARELTAIKASKITLRLDSPGGSVSQGIAIANLIRSHDAYVTSVIDGMAASIASVIAIAGDEVIVNPGGQMMVHRAFGLCVGNRNDMAKMQDVLDRQDANIAAAYKARAGGRLDTWLKRMDAESWYLADEAVAVGLADRVAEYPRKGKPAEDEPEEAPDMAAKADARVWDLSVFRYAGREKAPDPLAEPPQEPAAAVQPAATGADPAGTVRAEVEKALADLAVTAGAAPATALDLAAIGAVVRNALAEAGIGTQAAAVSPDGTAATEGDVGAQEQRLPSDDSEDRTETAPEAQAGTETGPPAEPEPAATAPPADDWATATAHLLTSSAGGWADATAHLTVEGA